MCIVVAGAAVKGAIEGAVLGAVERMAVNKLAGRDLTDGLAEATVMGAGIGVTPGAGSAIRMVKAVRSAVKATGYAEASVATAAEANAAGKPFVGKGARQMSPNRKTGQVVGEVNEATGNSYRSVHTDKMTAPHANLENAARGNLHLKVKPTGTASWWPW